MYSSFNEAIKCFEQLLKMNPFSVETLRLYARFLIQVCMFVCVRVGCGCWCVRGSKSVADDVSPVVVLLSLLDCVLGRW